MMGKLSIKINKWKINKILETSLVRRGSYNRKIVVTVLK